MKEIATLLLSIATLVTAIAGLIQVIKANRKSDRNSAQIAEVHKTTNSLSERNEAIATKLGIIRGVELEKQRAAAASLGGT